VYPLQPIAHDTFPSTVVWSIYCCAVLTASWKPAWVPPNPATSWDADFDEHPPPMVTNSGYTPVTHPSFDPGV
jgi:hypothetical protein